MSKRMAYLGPAGTDGEQAAKAFLARLPDKNVELVPCPNIRGQSPRLATRKHG